MLLSSLFVLVIVYCCFVVVLCVYILVVVLCVNILYHLSRWYREMAVKFNDYFEFPRELNMETYTAAYKAKIEGS